MPTEEAWCLDVHKVSYQMVVSQAQLPVRHAGCGLGNSVRTAPAAYWASWADALPGIVARFPAAAGNMLMQLSGLHALQPGEQHTEPACLVAAERGGKICSITGWTDRPSCIDINACSRPPFLASKRRLGRVAAWLAVPRISGSRGA